MYFDYEDLQFDEIDNDEYPTMVYYWWQAETSQIRDLICECEVNSDDEIFDIDTELSARFALTIYSARNFKLELVVNDENGRQNWYDVCTEFYNANEFIELIPDYGKLKIQQPEAV